MGVLEIHVRGVTACIIPAKVLRCVPVHASRELSRVRVVSVHMRKLLTLGQSSTYVHSHVASGTSLREPWGLFQLDNVTTKAA